MEVDKNLQGLFSSIIKLQVICCLLLYLMSTKDEKDVSPSPFRCRYSDRYNSGSKSYHFCSLLAVDDPHSATRHRYLAVAVSDGREIYLVDNAVLR